MSGQCLGLMFLCALLAACAPALESRHYSWQLWHTPVELRVRSATAEQASAAIADIQTDWATLERDWHAWKPSALTRANQAFSRSQTSEIPASLVELIEVSLPLHTASDGLFDPAVGGLVELWGFHTETFPIAGDAPEDAVLHSWLELRPRLTDLYRDGGRFGSHNSALQLDFAAIAEGVALQRAARLLRQHGIEHALFNLGGDVLALGSAEGRSWRVAIEDPQAEHVQALADTELRSGEGLFVSGNYRRYRNNPQGGRWAHVLDPRTARPVQGMAMAVVISDSPSHGDAASTALLIAGPAGMAALLANMQIRYALLLSEDDRLWITRDMEQRLRWQRQPQQLNRVSPPTNKGAG
ncbi:FAD:protein FMN transferase [Pseudomarimonas arenosa]|uniref:FAD:protein FMN transferase n=1 Tax=Pseudomarimonas arenosa TaxID=2774145 RepID=A0AAW3ZNX3_9GAMM|nr:FAD:protein FMN transferase [Pseudomarimonas arenosa]MBD8527883.1 FAD:protein FMN transferase [Pseudomarimonas arenosa]